MFRTFLWYFTISIIFIITIPFWIASRLIPGVDGLKCGQAILSFFAPIVLGTAGFKVEVSGQEYLDKGPALYIGNHQGLFDMVIALMKMGKFKAFLAKKEAKKIPFIGSWMSMMGCVFIDRGNVRSSLDSLKEVEANLSKGQSMIIFPEGTRSRSRKLGEFKAGAFRPALKTGVPIIPFVIDGSYHAWEEHHKISKATARLTILPPIETVGMEKERTKHIAEEVRARIQACLDENEAM